LTYVKRESILSQDQVNQILGVLYVARKAKIGITVTLCVVGALLLALCVVMLLKSKRMSRNESLGITDEDENEEHQERPRDKYFNPIQNESHNTTSVGNTMIENKNLNYLR